VEEGDDILLSGLIQHKTVSNVSFEVPLPAISATR
jgi:hypothetical protein